jgi:hypothetical protein
MATVLRREAQDSVTPERLPDWGTTGPLAEEAEKLLGYGTLKAKLPTLVKRSTLKERCGVLRQALTKLDDPPFTPESVTKYKKRMEWRALPWRERTKEWFLQLAAVACILFVIDGVLALIAWGTELAVAGTLGWICLGLFGSVVVFLLSALFACERYTVYREWVFISYRAEWQAIPISKYTEPIPEFALQTAVDLQKQFDDIQFEVEELVLKRNDLPFPSLFDPFLVAKLPDGSRYYLEVWNEPDFKGKRMA